MTKRMLIDATQAEETRVAIVSGNRLEEYDYESTVRKQLKGSIFLAKVTRVEPSLQAAFVDYGGNRHGFLPFSEIHPDYYRIPVADREELLAEAAGHGLDDDDLVDAIDSDLQGMDATEDGAEDESGDSAKDGTATHDGTIETDAKAQAIDENIVVDEIVVTEDIDPSLEEGATDDDVSMAASVTEEAISETVIGADDDVLEKGTDDEDSDTERDAAEAESASAAEDEEEYDQSKPRRRGRGRRGRARSRRQSDDIDTLGGEGDDEEVVPSRPNLRNKYKIQEVIKRRQIMLIQVNKEERGNKGAAVTTYISLPGRYCVLMPNSPRGGGISRKISNSKDRQRMKSILAELKIPDGMSVILRTAGVQRSKAEIKRDLDYLLRLWDQIREDTLKATAPALINEESNLAKRAIRDLYTRDIDEVIVAGETGYKTAKGFMKMLMPSHAKKVQRYKDDVIPLFMRYQVESQIDEIHKPTAQLKSGGYIVINPTEALVSIDVNSGRSTKERHIEGTALKTNLEAAEEVARQLRLRDLGGLVVIDFIDMEEQKNNIAVERRLKEAMANDRARVQIGRISPFGLLELSRQRLNPSLVEAHFEVCPHCEGMGVIRTVESAALTVLRALEEEGIRGRSAEVTVDVPTEVALYLLNQKRKMLMDIEQRHHINVFIRANDSLSKSDFDMDRVKAITDSNDKQAEENSGSDDQETADKPRRRRRRGGRKRNRNRQEVEESTTTVDGAQPYENDEQTIAAEEESNDEERKPRRRRRGRRGGRRRRGTAAETHEAEITQDSENLGTQDSENIVADAEAQAADTEAPSKPRRGLRKKAETQSAEAENTETVTDAEAQAADTEAPSKPRRGRRKKAEKAEAQKSAADQDAHSKDATKDKKTEVVDFPESSADPMPTKTPTKTEDKAEPAKKRRGWWNRLVE